MKVAIDARFLTYRHGMGNLVYNLLMQLVGFPGDEQEISTPHGDMIYFESR